MAQKTRSRKRPCRICGKWFIPNPRLGDRQKTCGADACKRQWHTAKCAEWNRQNRPYFKEIYLRSRLEAASPDVSEPSPPLSPRPPAPARGLSPLHFPQEVIQEVMGAQQCVIIEYIVRLLLRGVQELISVQHLEISNEFGRLVGMSSLRDDSRPRPPGVSSPC
jgi:hypothetical protein